MIISDIIYKKKSSLTKLLCVGRHVNISCAFMLQRYSGNLPPILRENMSLIAIGNLNGANEVESVLENYTAHLGMSKKEAFKQLLVWYEDAILQN
jgi:cytochrome c-type biogenesis protein CcmE